MVRKCAKHVHGNPLGYRAEIPDTLSIQLGGPPFSWTNQCAPKVQVLSTCSRRETGILNPYCSELKLRPYFDFSDGFMQWLTLSCLRPRGTPRSYHAWNPNILPQKTEHRRTHQTLRPLSVGHQGISNMWLWAVHGHSWALAPASSSDSSSNCLLGRLGSMTVSVRAKRLKTTLLACTDMYWHVLTIYAKASECSGNQINECCFSLRFFLCAPSRSDCMTIFSTIPFLLKDFL